MSALRSFMIEWLEPIEGSQCEQIVPGTYVKHRLDGGFGIVVSRVRNTIQVLWSVVPKRPPFQFPNVRRVFNSPVARELMSIQPMTMDYAYGSGSKGPP